MNGISTTPYRPIALSGILLAISVLLFIMFPESLKPSTLATLFLSILLEALPFLLIGTFLSSLVEVTVSQENIERLIPRNPVAGVVVASLVGLVFPVCECAIVPLTGRLVKKGVPLPGATTFMLAVPIVNPLVILSTYYAFNGRIIFLWYRLAGGLFTAIAIGLALIVILRNSDESLLSNSFSEEESCGCGHDHHHHGNSKLRAVLDHTFDEFFDVGKYFIMGALLSAAFQAYLPREIVFAVGGHPLGSVAVMAGLAYILSVCSEADAFIARSFLGQFSPGAVLTFMTLGPMIDVKNTLMLGSRFKKSYIVLVMILVFFANIQLGFFLNVLL